jgi:ABC-type Na+ efflux pump permease subunit
VLLVFRKDWREIRRNWQVMTPILIVPLLFTVAIPAAVILLPGLMNVPTSTTAFLELMVENLPGNIKSQLLGMAEDQVMIFVMLLYFFAPFFLIIPVMASSVIASDSFAGEKERKRAPPGEDPGLLRPLDAGHRGVLPALLCDGGPLDLRDVWEAAAA